MKALQKLFALIVGLTASATLSGQNIDSLAFEPCPSIQVIQKHNHTPLPYYRQQGWDTVVGCAQQQIVLSVRPYIPARFFNGTYLVEQIAFNPPDPSFHQGTWLPITSDDIYCNEYTNIPYDFYFFGKKKSGFTVGSNGMVCFNDVHGQHCEYSLQSSDRLPWADTRNYKTMASTLDAIFGIMEDTHPIQQYTNNAAPYYQGIWYGIQGEYPCRKIICNWNDVPQYPAASNQNNRCTYQIVCFEGSNIIEVHVKKRMQSSTGWNGLLGMIGIINETGDPQVKSDNRSDPNYEVVTGSPAAFFPQGYAPFTQALDSIAFRFTPKGNTSYNLTWTRLFDDGTSVTLGTDPNDTNGYATRLEEYDPAHSIFQSTATISPTVTSRYACELRFRNAKGDWYILNDTITIGIDTARDMTLTARSESGSDTAVLNVCHGQTVNCDVTYPTRQLATDINWRITRQMYGVEHEVPQSLYSINPSLHTLTLHPDNRQDTLPRNKIDSIWVQASPTFANGCNSFRRMLIKIYPNFDTIEYAGICDGASFYWDANGQRYTQPTNLPQVNMHSRPGCDSIVHLHLSVSGVSRTIDHVVSCQPYTWRNGQTYYDNNSGTVNEDTVRLLNRFGCDSIVVLNFELKPVKAAISASRSAFTFDNLDITLIDNSVNNDSRTWIFPDGSTQTSTTAYYTIPVNLPGADITLVAHHQSGCDDSTSVFIPMNRESFWIPNAFTPDAATGNNLFGSTSIQTLSQEMQIFDRRGQLVFQCEGVDCTWDGHYSNGDIAPQGTYIYIIHYTTQYYPDRRMTKRGTVTLIR
ncbi:MAG: gliding motility-associated C-terminal domain-containing protein [Bacteroidales bacterium]|nr:gliding motility-associated C-terminal domain-containing protein [Bacteroidales bacterium]